MSELKQNDNFKWWISKPNFFSSDECDEFIKRVEEKEKVGDYSDIQQKLWLSAKISNQLSWNFNIKEVEDNIKMIKYTPGDFYTWHSDFNAGSSSTRKLVTIVQLTDPSEYEGGETQLAIQDPQTMEYYTMPQEKGTLVIFSPIFFHRVTPVTKGTRYCLQEFISGDTFV